MPAATEQASDAMTTSYDVQIRAALDRLAAFSGPGQIASYFKTEGITGLPGEPTQCPVARWVTKQVTLPENCKFSMGFSAGRVVKRQAPWICETMWKFPVAAAVAEFVWLFDNRRYPQLERRHADA